MGFSTSTFTVACASAVLILATMVAAASAADIRTLNGCVLRPGTLCIGLDLHGAKLHGADLARADFSRTDLSGADLSEADLTNADMDNVDLTGANLTQAIL